MLYGARMDSGGHAALAVLWGKSNAGGTRSLLLQHLLEAAAMGEVIWDRYLARSVREKIDACCDGAGRELLSLVCGLHDVGKATPAFQSKVHALADEVRAAGLTWNPLRSVDTRWHHTLAGAVIVREVLGEAGWRAQTLRWILPMITGHHGVVPDVRRYQNGDHHGHGKGPLWRQCQRDLVLTVVAELGIDLAGIEPRGRPSRAVQLAFSGAVIMADWIASSNHFPGIADITDVSMPRARPRAERAWQRLGLGGGWREGPNPSVVDLIQHRFEKPARSIQRATVELAASLPAAGLLLVEAPMGEGKTEAALAATEVLASRFGADGVFVGMPTQATSDAMFRRVMQWARQVEPGTQLGLLHGKRRFNREWHKLQQDAQFFDICDDEYGCPDDYGTAPSDAAATNAVRTSKWFLIGRNRGLLVPVAVGTIDQLLFAATKTRHVMLRHLGLAGRVVVLDEVHAYDVYMMQFLTEALRWLGDAGVPVVLLSATLPPHLRADLARAYLQGVLRESDLDLPAELTGDDAYPAVRALTVVDGQVRVDSRHAAPWREPVPVAVEVLGEAPDDPPDSVVGVVRQALVDGGCALVVRNTVGRAQRTYRAIRAAYGDEAEVVLLHARLAIGDRADRTERVLDLLGPPGRDGAPERPKRLVVVATQVAEQSFDVDVDLLVTDLAPIDLLLQRVGRLHRHDRPEARPLRVRAARVVVAGVAFEPGQPPVFPRGSEYVYGRHLLLRAAVLVHEAAGASWSIPAQVPELVRRGYGDERLGPTEWWNAMTDAHRGWEKQQEVRRDNARPYVLAGEKELHCDHLAGLHVRRARDLTEDEDLVGAMVRDGPPTIEVVMVRRTGDQRCTLDGRPLGINDVGVTDPDTAEAVLRSAVRLPTLLTDAAVRDLHPLTESGDDAWLSHTRVLELDANSTAVLGGRRLTYDPELGLVDEPAR